MKRVQLVVTGKCEQVLHESLQQVFPELEWPSPIFVDAFTSASLEEPIPPGLMRTIDKFALKLIELVDSEDDCLVMGVDDLEDNSPENTTNAIRSAIARVLLDERIAKSAPKRARVERELRERCSFHLLRPMVEAYFFADSEALQRAGAIRPSRFEASSDCELFDVEDADFSAPPDSDDKFDWRRGGPARRRHPKRYVKFLSSNADGVWSYRETKHGQAALRSLDWQRVCATPVHVTVVRALLNDIADFAEGRAREGAELADTSRATKREVRVLRNL